MSFQAYLDTVEDKTGLTPRQFITLAGEKGFGPGTKAAVTGAIERLHRLAISRM